MSEVTCKVQGHSVTTIRERSGRHNFTVAGVGLLTLQVRHIMEVHLKYWLFFSQTNAAVSLLRLSDSFYALMCSHLLGCFQLCHPKYISWQQPQCTALRGLHRPQSLRAKHSISVCVQLTDHRCRQRQDGTAESPLRTLRIWTQDARAAFRTPAGDCECLCDGTEGRGW